MTKAVHDLMGDGALMFASDYPHPETIFPDHVDTVIAWRSVLGEPRHAEADVGECRALPAAHLHAVGRSSSMIDRPIPWDASPRWPGSARVWPLACLSRTHRRLIARSASVDPAVTTKGADIDMAGNLAETLGVGLEFPCRPCGPPCSTISSPAVDIAMGGVTVTPGARREGLLLRPELHRRQAALGAARARRSFHLGRGDRPARRQGDRQSRRGERSVRPRQLHPGHGDHPPRQRHRLRRAGRRPRRRDGHRRARSRPPGASPPELVAVPVAAPFTRLEKAYFFARDPAMKRFIDDWLGEAMGAGRWQRALDRAMHAAG